MIQCICYEIQVWFENSVFGHMLYVLVCDDDVACLPSIQSVHMLPVVCLPFPHHHVLRFRLRLWLHRIWLFRMDVHLVGMFVQLMLSWSFFAKTCAVVQNVCSLLV